MNIKSNKYILGAAFSMVALNISSQSKPNVVLIMTDQQSFNAISAYADACKESYFNTPNIDRLVKSGTSFMRTYCANPVSVPSRFSLFTGRYGGQYGIRDNKCAEAEESEVRNVLATSGMGEVFSKNGYDTYYGGKVHLPFSGKTGKGHFSAPYAYGFENYYSKDERDDLGKDAASIIDEKGKFGDENEKPFLLVASFLNPHDICLESSTGLSDIVPDKGGRKQVITECVREMRALAQNIDSVEFYKSHAPQLPYNFDKTALYPSTKQSVYKDFPEYYWRKYRWIYGQLVSLVDSHIGHILDALDRNPQLKSNTIIVFTSDHGEMQGAHQMVTKGVPYDECQRVPFIFSGPGVKVNHRDYSLVCNGVDLLPTICDLAGIEMPVADGLSLSSRILGQDDSVLRKALYVEGEKFLSIINDTVKYTLFDRNKEGEMLINLQLDNGESKNIIHDNMNVAKEMRQYIPTNITPKYNHKLKKK